MEKTKLKILHICCQTGFRGGEQQLVYLLRVCQLQQVNQLVLCIEGSMLQQLCIAERIPCRALSAKALIGLRISYQIHSFMKQYQPDLIHVHDSRAHTYTYMAALLFKHQFNIVVSRHVIFPIKTSWLSQKKYTWKKVVRYICISNAVKEQMQLSLPDKDNRLFSIIPCGIDLQRFQYANKGLLRNQYNIHESTTVIGTVGALTHEKDHRTFLDVIAMVSKTLPDIKAVIIGEGPLKSFLIEHAQFLGIQDKVIFTGAIQHVEKLLPDFNVFLLTSEKEGLCQAVLEAMAAAIPVVATDCGGVHQMMLHESTGLIAPVRDIKTLSQAVIRLLQDEHLTPAIIQQANLKVQSFDYLQMGLKNIQLYETLIGPNDKTDKNTDHAKLSIHA